MRAASPARINTANGPSGKPKEDQLGLSTCTATSPSACSPRAGSRTPRSSRLPDQKMRRHPHRGRPRLRYGRAWQLYQRATRTAWRTGSGALSLALKALALFNTRYMDAAVPPAARRRLRRPRRGSARLSPYRVSGRGRGGRGGRATAPASGEGVAEVGAWPPSWPGGGRHGTRRSASCSPNTSRSRSARTRKTGSPTSPRSCAADRRRADEAIQSEAAVRSRGRVGASSPGFAQVEVDVPGEGQCVLWVVGVEGDPA